MTEPAHAFIAALIAHRAAQPGNFSIIGNDDAAFASGYLLVGIKGECAAVADGPGRRTVNRGADSFAGVFNNRERMFAGNSANRGHIRRQSEHMHRQNSFCAGSDRCFYSRRVDIESNRVDIHEYGNRALKEHAVGRSDE